MPTYTVTAPDGKDYSIDGPEGASREEVITAIQSRMGEIADTSTAPRVGDAAWLERKRELDAIIAGGDEEPGFLENVGENIGELSVWPLLILLFIGALTIVATRSNRKENEDKAPPVNTKRIGFSSGRLFVILFLVGAALVFIFSDRGEDHPLNNPSDVYCRQLYQETYAERLEEALFNPSAWKFGGYENAQDYAYKRASGMLAIAKCN